MAAWLSKQSGVPLPFQLHKHLLHHPSGELCTRQRCRRLLCATVMGSVVLPSCWLPPLLPLLPFSAGLPLLLKLGGCIDHLFTCHVAPSLCVHKSTSWRPLWPAITE